MNSVFLNGIKINIGSKNEFVEEITLSLRNNHRPIHIIGINPYLIYHSLEKKYINKLINDSDFVNIDGYSLVFNLKFKGIKNCKRVACPDLFEDLLKYYNIINQPIKIFLFGSTKEIIDGVIKYLNFKYSNIIIVGSNDGYIDKNKWNQLAYNISNLSPDFLILGLPTPLKEEFVNKYGNTINTKLIFGIGGYFDIMAGKKKRAPLLIQKIGFEWFYRFIQEPLKMSKRLIKEVYIFIKVFTFNILTQ